MGSDNGLGSVSGTAVFVAFGRGAFDRHPGFFRRIFNVKQTPVFARVSLAVRIRLHPRKPQCVKRQILLRRQPRSPHAHDAKQTAKPMPQSNALSWQSNRLVQFDPITVWILDESDYPGAAFHRAGLAHKFHTL